MNRRYTWVLVPLLLALLVGNISAQSSAGIGKPQKAGNVFDVNVRCNVRGATIAIDGILQRETAPGVVRVPEGQHIFKVTAPGYSIFEQRVNVDSALNLNVTLTQQQAQKNPVPQPVQPVGHRIEIRSNVPNAQVFINGLLQGRAPHDMALTPGRYQLKVTAPGFEDYETTISVNRPDTITAFLQPQNYSLGVNVNINGAKVFINGNLAGSAPLRTAVRGGTYSIRVTAPDFQDYEATVNMDRDVSLAVNLQPVTFVLGITSNVNGAQVFLDGNVVGNAPYQVAVMGGMHTVRVTAPGFLDYLATVEVKANTQLSAALTPTLSTVTVEIPDTYLEQAKKGTPRELQIFVDGRLQTSTSFQLTPGKHVVRFTTGGISFEKEITLEASKPYTLQLFMDFIVR